jgi:hypothetical protein
MQAMWVLQQESKRKRYRHLSHSKWKLKDRSENKPRQVNVLDISNWKDIRFVTLRVRLCHFETVESFMYLSINIRNKNNRTEETQLRILIENKDFGLQKNLRLGCCQKPL